MTTHAVRFRLLMLLSWALCEERCTSIMVTPHQGEPVLYVPLPYGPGRQAGAKLAVLAFQHSGRWFYAWGGGGMAVADQAEVTARTIAKLVVA